MELKFQQWWSFSFFIALKGIVVRRPGGGASVVLFLLILNKLLVVVESLRLHVIHRSKLSSFVVSTAYCSKGCGTIFHNEASFVLDLAGALKDGVLAYIGWNVATVASS